MTWKTATITENTQLSPGVSLLRADCAPDAAAGQFFMLKKPDSGVLLPRAISVCDQDVDGILFACQNVGPGTAELCALRPGDPIHMTGPLGNGFPLDQLSKTIALVCGGIGIAPMLYTARMLHERGAKLTCLAGFRSNPFLVGSLAEFCDVHVATEDGSCGRRGYVTDLLKPEDYDTVLCCGPEPMMRAVTRACMDAKTPVYVSLENKMACGIGACLVCTCTDKNGKNRRTCMDGPVFRGEEIDFEA